MYEEVRLLEQTMRSAKRLLEEAENEVLKQAQVCAPCAVCGTEQLQALSFGARCAVAASQRV